MRRRLALLSCLAVMAGSAACVSDRPPVCAFDRAYTFHTSHGLSPLNETGTLSPPSSFVYTKVPFPPPADGGTSPTCAPPLPACAEPGLVDVADLMADIADPAVQQALARTPPPSFGSIGGDEDELSFSTDSGAFAVSLFDCTPPSTFCTPIPRGIQKLTDDLQALVTQSLQDPSCAALR
jgi:hypothetical protein